MKDKKEKKKKSHKDDKRSERKIRKKAKKEKKKREKRLKEQMKSAKKAERLVPKPETAPALPVVNDEDDEDCGPPIGKFGCHLFRKQNTNRYFFPFNPDLMNRAKCPETKEQWDKRQSQIKRVVDPETGRTR